MITVTDFRFPYTEVCRKYIDAPDTLLALGGGTLRRESTLGAKHILSIDWALNPEAIGRGVHIRYDVVRIFPHLYDNSFDVVTIFDFIEHLPKEDGCIVLREAERVGKTILCFVPIQDPATIDIVSSSKEQRILQREGKPLNHHLSTWTPEDFGRRGYVVEVSPTYHKDKGFGAMVCVKQ